MTDNAILTGIHHVTAITGDAQKNIDFYCDVLGLRLVKLTVNFDDPASYHIYYGDELGHPGSVMTFFAWPGGQSGHIGPSQVTTTAFAVPEGALGFWQDRLSKNNIEFLPIVERFGEEVLSFRDPDNMELEIIAMETPGGRPWHAGPIPAQNAICGFHGVTISEEGYERTARLLSDVMQYQAAENEGNRFRYRTSNSDGLATVVDLLCVPDARRGRMGAGVVHHVAFRTPNDSQQLAWHRQIISLGYNVSPVMDRNYFHSIYYREPGGVLFEIATDVPGFTVDESADELGTALKLPPQYEPIRTRIEGALPPIRLPRHYRK